MKKLITLLVLLVLTVTLKAQTIKPDPTLHKVMNAIINLKEVKARDLYVRKQTKGERHLEYIVDSEPSKLKPYYTINVGEDNGGAIHSHFFFFVYPKSMQVKVIDEISGKTMDLKTWRDHQKQ